MKKQPIDLGAFREWMSWPEERRQAYLTSAECPACRQAGAEGPASFAPGYRIRRNPGRLFVDGYCAECGERITRVCD